MRQKMVLEPKMAKFKEFLEFYKDEHRRLTSLDEPTYSDKIDNLILELLIDYMDETLEVIETQEKPVGYCGACIPTEIFRAMDIHPWVAEFMTALLPGMKEDAIGQYYAIAEREGMPPELCGADKGPLGLLLSHEFPKPDLMVACSLPCDNLVVTYQIYDTLLGMPTFYTDAPYGNTADDIGYYANEMKKAVTFMEEQTGRKMDYDKLREVLKEYNRCLNYWLEIVELRKITPCPQKARLLALNDMMNLLGGGKPKTTALYKVIRDQAKENAEKGVGVANPEKHRVIWFMLPLYFGMDVYDWMEEELGVSIPMDMVSYTSLQPIDTSTPESMLRGLAEKTLGFPMARQLRGAAELYTDDLYRVYHDYNADAVIYAGHEGCKMGWGMVGLIRDVCKEMKAPLLVFSVDVMYGRPGQNAEIRSKIEEFFKIISTK